MRSIFRFGLVGVLVFGLLLGAISADDAGKEAELSTSSTAVEVTPSTSSSSLASTTTTDIDESSSTTTPATPSVSTTITVASSTTTAAEESGTTTTTLTPPTESSSTPVASTSTTAKEESGTTNSPTNSVATTTASPTEGTTTTVKPPVKCQNGGFSQNRTCICPSYFEGEACEKLVCINGGYEVERRCRCPPGFWGVRCDSVTELQSPKSGFAQPVDTFNLYVYNEISIYNGAVSLSAFINAVENDTHVQIDYTAYNYWHYTDATHGVTAAPLAESKMLHTTSWEDFKAAIQSTTFADPDYACTPKNLYQNLIDLIRQQQLASTTITVFTQFPGHSHWEVYDRLMATALAFGVRINFIIPDDPLLLGCDFSNNEFSAMRALTVSTGGSFVIVNDKSASVGIAPIIKMHYRTQLIAFASYDDCTSADFNFHVDVQPKEYTVIVGSSDNTGTLDCQGFCASLNATTQNSHFYTLYSAANLPQNWKLVFKGPCMIQVLTDQPSVRLFQSFVPSANLDSSYVQPVEDIPSFVRIHAEIDGIAAGPDAQVTINQGNTTYSASSTFPYVTQNATVCRSNQTWSNVELIVNGASYNRYLPYNCFKTTPDFLPTTTVIQTTTFATTSTTTEALATNNKLTSEADDEADMIEALAAIDNSTTVSNDYSTTVPSDNSTTTDAPDTCANSTLPNLFIAVSCAIGEDELDNFASGAMNTNTEGLFASYEVVVLNTNKKANPVQAFHAINAEQFQDLITSALASVCDGVSKSQKTDISDVLQTYVVKAKLSNSPIVLAVPSTDVGTIPEATLQYLASNRDTVFGIIQITESATYDDNSQLSILTTVTGGQIFASVNASDAATDITTYVLDKLSTSKQIIAANKNALPSPYQIGYLDIDGRDNATFEVTVTGLHMAGVLITISDAPMWYIQRTDDSTNFEHKTVTVTKSGPITVQFFSIESNIYNLRVWSAVDDQLQLNIGDVHDASGASLHASAPSEEVSNATVTFYDCKGLKVESQTAGGAPWNISENSCGADIEFVPFFCKSAQATCLVKGTEDLYSYQLTTQTTVGSYQHWGSFMCPKATLTENDCNKGTLTDGVCKCTPEFAGPKCQVPNCNSNGKLYYDEESHSAKCSCNSGFSGPNCDIATCDSNQAVSAALFDPAYRTLTVVMLYSAQDDRKDLHEHTVKTLPEKASSAEYPNIYTYHAYAQNAEQRDVLVLGNSLNTAQIDVGSIAGNSSDAVALENTVAYALNAAGRQQRGIVWITVSSKANVTVDIDAFYRTISGFRQEVFVSVFGTKHKPEELDSLSKAVLATGGQLMVYDTSKDTAVNNTILTNILPTSASLSFYPESSSYSTTTDVTIPKGQFVIVSTNKDSDKIDQICSALKSKATYLCAGVTDKDIIVPQNFQPYISARDLSDTSLSWTFVASASDSSWTAIPSNETTVTNLIVHTVNGRVDAASRPGFINRGAACPIQADFVVPTTTVGYNRVEVSLKGKGSRMIPFAVVAGAPDCQNGGESSGGYCSCAGPYIGADCSIPDCQNGGILNTQATACHCDESKYYGIACEHTRNSFW